MRNIESEHERYLHQARWTEDLRSYIFGKIKAAQKSRVLEVGSGTGAILGQLDSEFSNFAMDIEHQALRYSRDRFLHVKHIQGDGHSLPYPSGTFQICTCHFLLLWVDNAERILAEMKRVTRPGGWVIAFAEPDYGGRIDFPESLAELGTLQASALERQGADIKMGRKLAQLFSNSELNDIEHGVMGMQYSKQEPGSEENEQQTLAKDVEGMIAADKLRALQAIEKLAFEQGSRINFVPTFYAFGKKG